MSDATLGPIGDDKVGGVLYEIDGYKFTHYFRHSDEITADESGAMRSHDFDLMMQETEIFLREMAKYWQNRQGTNTQVRTETAAQGAHRAINSEPSGQNTAKPFIWTKNQYGKDVPGCGIHTYQGQPAAMRPVTGAEAWKAKTRRYQGERLKEEDSYVCTQKLTDANGQEIKNEKGYAEYCDQGVPMRLVPDFEAF